MQKAKVRENVKEYALLTLGTVIMTLGIYFFKFPNHFPPAASAVWRSF